MVGLTMICPAVSVVCGVLVVVGGACNVTLWQWCFVWPEAKCGFVYTKVLSRVCFGPLCVLVYKTVQVSMEQLACKVAHLARPLSRCWREFGSSAQAFAVLLLLLLLLQKPVQGAASGAARCCCCRLLLFWPLGATAAAFCIGMIENLGTFSRQVLQRAAFGLVCTRPINRRADKRTRRIARPSPFGLRRTHTQPSQPSARLEKICIRL